MEIVELEQYYDIVKRLMRLGREGGYWDFKREYPSNKAELLLDIICMANNQEDRDAYLIYGIQERSWQVIGVENDKNRLKLNQLSQFLSGKHFAVYIPQIDLQTIVLENHEIDILIVHNTKHTPYYLEKDFVYDDKKVIRGVIYSRLNDRKTGTSEATPYTCVEHLWKKRFGIDMSIMQKLHMRLEEYDKWQFDWGNKKYAYHIDFPEFRIEIEGDFKEGWIPSAAFYTHPVFYYVNLNIYYHNTVIYETSLWSFDEFRRYLPAAKDYAVKFKMDYWYTYYDLSEIEGKLLKIFTSGKCNISSREANRSQILIFKNERDKCEFDMYLHEHFSDYTDDYIMDEYKYQIEEENRNEFGGGIYSAFQVAKTAKIYDKWCNETGRKYYEDWI